MDSITAAAAAPPTEESQGISHRWPAARWGETPAGDGYKSRQKYLKSYTFSKKETLPERAKKFLIKIKERSSPSSLSAACRSAGRRLRRTRVKKISCAALDCLPRRLLSCTCLSS